MVDPAREQWRELLDQHDPDSVEVDAVFAELSNGPGAPNRWPHDARRLRAVLRWIERLEHRAHDPQVVRLAAWASDAGGPDPDGARWAAGFLPRVGVPPATLIAVERLLALLPGYDPADDDPDGQVLGDATLAVLGAPSAEYRNHVGRLRAASGLVGAAWREHRLAVVHELLGRDSVFCTPELRATREGRAQLNLAREAAALRAGAATPRVDRHYTA